ncbi:Uncharacterised protein [Enterobacter hormaechei]|nr:hypothetical protein AI2762V1_1112 [Enterobacter cloacae]CZW49165.1 Uncharacterised protein [Enterobacter hormaechei]CAH3565134.1 hypothetical protein AI2762V1_1112 [Enterobacter cloacae]CZZ40275.1 Uncharacterised protein [Enterobacter hormaechei]SAA49664.1 Uncharacterised protein [Enterobacter hormaechei]
MVTRLSGTPLFAKSRLKKLIKAASGGLFYARQRVTTEGKAMAKVVLVWNPQKTECVGFLEREPDGSTWDCGSDGDAEHAAGGMRWNPVSTLADSFREQYEDVDDECFMQTIEVDQSLADAVEREEED